jgi:crotonobetainyl-CoA:carnitine CoA-transferase CaiB-like acyl-CoA transferase
MIEIVLNVTAVQTMEFEVFGSVMERRGNRGHTAAVQDVYRCAGEDSWVAVAVRPGDDTALADVIGDTSSVAEWLATQDAEAATQKLTNAGIPAAVVISPSLVTDNPQLAHRGFFERLEHPRTGEGLYPSPPFARLDGAERWLLRTPPTLGQHNEEVLTELCGLTAADLARLTADGVIGTRPKGA